MGRAEPDAETVGRPAALAIVGSTAIVLAYVYFAYVDYPRLGQRLSAHREILDGTAQSPNRYRVLVPFLADALIGRLSGVMPAERAFLVAYGLYDVVVFAFLMTALYVYVRRWFSRTETLVGILFAAATMPIALRDHFFQPWSPLEAALFTLGLLLSRDRRRVLLAATIVVAALNRETAIFLALACCLTGLDPAERQRSRSALALGGLWVVLWLAVFVGLRWIRGVADHLVTVSEIWAINTTPKYLARALVNHALFGGAFGVLAILGFRHAPRHVRRSAYVVPLYLAAVAVFGMWFEVRLLMPLYPILIPLALSFLYRRGEASFPAAEAGR